MTNIAESVGISDDICQQILTKNLTMHSLPQHIVTRMPNGESKGNSNREMTSDLISAVEKVFPTWRDCYWRREKVFFYLIINPKEHRRCRYHHNLPSSRNSAFKITLKGRVC
ncbi:hypothetical protein TNCV_1491741 [Trichonephila clavipes]|nr:hypothetical protein TNCV_1491741 [Trichonephila clavipes]